ncbi:MAG: hypothetical protein WCJ18_11980, partial [Planctomycetota bacterium]
MARIFAVAGMVAIVIATTVAEAGLSINAVTVDGKAIPIPAGSGTGSGTREPLRIPSTAGRVVLAFEGDSAATIPPDDEQTSSSPSGTGTPPHPRDSRLCYRLDGFDASWRDIPATGRMSLGFEDEERGLIDRVEVELAGESPGWNGDVQTAPLVAGRASAVVPPTAVGLRANLISSYFGSAVGVVALDDVRFLIEHADGRHSEQAVAVDLGESPSLDRLPRNWTKSGTKLAMSRLVMRRSPEPHPILTIIDDEPVRYGSWMHGPKIAIAPGDRVTLTWSAAWSSGSGGEATADYENLKPGTDFFRVGAFYPNGEPTGVEAVM